MDQLQPITSAMHSVQMVPDGPVSSLPASVQSLTSNEHMMPSLEPIPQYSDDPQNISTSYGFQQLIIPDFELGDVGAIFRNFKPQTVPMPVKRKSPMEELPAYLSTPREVMPNKKTEQLEHRPWLNMYSPNQSNAQHQVQSLASVLASQQWVAKKKRTTQARPPKSGFQKFSIPRSHSIQGHPSPKVQSESNETVRFKFRESISAALALVTEKEKSLCTKDTSTSAGVISMNSMQEVSQSAEFTSSGAPAEPSVGKQNVVNEGCPTECDNNLNSQRQLSDTDAPSHVSDSDLTHFHESVSHELNVIDMLTDEESIAGNFFAKDDLLQGNGLSWVLDFDTWVAEKEGNEPKKQKVGENMSRVQEFKKTNSPQILARQIELELFKLFDGVNKKYKEKGRSLLFNLKDKNNPELRERVMSGEISPARLCSMTADELASKELSEWRIAKAEEFEHLKILPDSDIDIRRLVKKTHKGDYQVDVEEDDISVEVSVGLSSLSRIATETKEKKSSSDQVSDGDQVNAIDNKNNSEQNRCTITIPSNISSDRMQGIIEDDLKDAEFLPPIVSLDEFMESLQEEPPFENLSADAQKTAASVDKDSSEVSQVTPENKSAKLSPVGHTCATTKTEDNSDSKDSKLDTDTKPTDGQLEAEVSPPVTVSKGVQLWEGILQLSSSSKISVSGFFKSGEKASTKDWPRTIDIKGRVRLDAFEKFLHDLHKSRSRAVMVMHLILKVNKGKESEYLSQVVDSYVSDDRVGIAEPVRGYEAYLCPCHPKIIDRIVKHLTKEQSVAFSLADGDKGLIGILVWRKALVSPNPSSHHKQTLKKHQQEHSGSRKHNHQQERNMNVKPSNTNPKELTTVSLVSSKVPYRTPIKAATVEDEVPPGFGPSTIQDDDDLPEFNFSSELSRPAPTQKPVVATQTQNRPDDQMRQLIQKYGQNAGSGIVIKPWDDDDIPEWQPPQAPLPPAPRPVEHNYQRLNQHMLQHQQLLSSPLQQPQAASLSQLPTLATQLNVTHGWAQQHQQSRLWMSPQGPQSRGF